MLPKLVLLAAEVPELGFGVGELAMEPSDVAVLDLDCGGDASIDGIVGAKLLGEGVTGDDLFRCLGVPPRIHKLKHSLVLSPSMAEARLVRQCAGLLTSLRCCLTQSFFPG